MDKERLNDPSCRALILPKQQDSPTSADTTTDLPLVPQKPSYLDVLPQILASCIALSSVPQAGINLAFSGVLIPQLAKDETIHGFTKESASWVASIVAIAQPIGALFVGPLMDAIGRRKTCIVTNIPILIGWIIIYFTKSNLWPIYLARALCGFGSGMTTVGLVYTAEVSHSQYRPMLLSLNSVNVALGILLTTILGVYLDWHTCALLFGAMALVSGGLSFFIPESPQWLISFTPSSNESIAKHVRSLNRPEWLFKEEWERLQESKSRRRTSTEEEQNRSKSTLRKLQEKIAVFFERSSLKPMTVLLIIFFLQQTSGTYVVIFYTVNIFRALGGNFGFGIDEYTATITLGVLRFIMSFVSAVLSKVMGRRPIMLISSVGMGFSCVVTAVCLHLNGITTINFQTANQTLSNVTVSAVDVASGTVHAVSSWWILISILSFVVAGSIGHMVIPWTLMGELLPTKIRASGSGIMVSYSSLLLFAVIKTFPGLLDYTTLPVLFISYAVMSFVSAFYVQTIPSRNFPQKLR
uniref:Facilitated trehalose transporter Tret1 n=1 Tax=Lygus hesperus TaxID=30085 RepID=A0A0A9Y8B7_LYGHE